MPEDREFDGLLEKWDAAHREVRDLMVALHRQGDKASRSVLDVVISSAALAMATISGALSGIARATPECANPDCVDGVVPDPDQCGDRDHCPGGKDCPTCKGRADG